MNSIKSKKRLFLFASFISLSCFVYMNFIIQPEINSSSEVRMEEEVSAPSVMAPDLAAVSRFIEIGKKLIAPLR